MATVYAQLLVSLPWHEKVCNIPIADAPAALGLYAASLCWCQANLTDGVILKPQVAALMPMRPRDAKRLSSVLVACELWDETDSAFVIHDYLDWNKSREEILALREVRRSAGQAGGKQRVKQMLEQNGSKTEANFKPSTATSSSALDDSNESSLAKANFPPCMKGDSWQLGDSEYQSSTAHILKAIESKHQRLATPQDIGAIGKALRDGCVKGCSEPDGGACAAAMVAQIQKAYTIKKACEFYVTNRKGAS